MPVLINVNNKRIYSFRNTVELDNTKQAIKLSLNNSKENLRRIYNSISQSNSGNLSRNNTSYPDKENNTFLN